MLMVCSVPVSGEICPGVAVSILDSEQLSIGVNPDQCRNIGQWSQRHSVVCLNVTLYQTLLAETQEPTHSFRVPVVLNLLHSEFHNGSNELVFTVPKIITINYSYEVNEILIKNKMIANSRHFLRTLLIRSFQLNLEPKNIPSIIPMTS